MKGLHKKCNKSVRRFVPLPNSPSLLAYPKVITRVHFIFMKIYINMIEKQYMYISIHMYMCVCVFFDIWSCKHRQTSNHQAQVQYHLQLFKLTLGAIPSQLFWRLWSNPEMVVHATYMYSEWLGYVLQMSSYIPHAKNSKTPTSCSCSLAFGT